MTSDFHAAIGTDDEKRVRIEDTAARWDGYLSFRRHPDEVLARLEQHMADGARG